MLYLKDCIEGMADLPKASVDLILTHHGGGIETLPDRHFAHQCAERKETEQ